ncbi:MAG TPA: tetratricopeptide repeat protein [Pyrinomonadaceae bacterium]|nr:tetratricopeptide repeat protein [Pyrinomonadaceae bacterium]
MSQQASDLYEFGPFRIDTRNRLLFRDGKQIPLKPKVVETLLVLVENSGRVLEKDELIQKLWPDTFVEEGNLTQNIYVLRKALSDGSQSETYIETIPRRGYRFAGEVRKVTAGHTSPVAIAHPSARWLWLGGFLLAVALAGGFFWLSTRARSRSSTTPIKTLAILPFRPLTSGSGDDYIGQGMADALITKLSNSPQIAIRPTTAVLRYADANRDPLAAGRALDVEAVLDGKVQREGERVRITVQLLRVSDGASLWAEQYDEAFTDIFALQDSISAQAARSLTLQLTGSQTASMRKHYTENSKAYESYLQGHFFFNKRNAAGFKKAIEHFDKALSIDPNYALAYAGLADCYLRLNEFGVPMTQEAVPHARASVMKALAIDDTLAEAHATLAFIKFRHDWDFAGADSEFKRSLQLDANYSEAHQWYAFFLLAVGRANEADSEMKRAQESDPLSVSLNSNLALYLFFRHKFDESLQQCRKTLEMEPNFTLARITLGLNYEQKGSSKEAIAEFKKAQEMDPNDVATTAALGHALAKKGDTTEARRLLSELRDRAKMAYVPPYSIAILYAGLGEQSEAVDWLERGLQDRSLRPLWLRLDPRLDTLQRDDRFIQLMRKMGLN